MNPTCTTQHETFLLDMHSVYSFSSMLKTSITDLSPTLSAGGINIQICGHCGFESLTGLHRPQEGCHSQDMMYSDTVSSGLACSWLCVSVKIQILNLSTVIHKSVL